MGIPITGDGRVEGGLGGPAGFGEVVLARSDDGALRLDVSAVFPTGLNHFGRTIAPSDLWVNTNGTLSFGAALPGYPTAANAGLRTDMIGAFWADLDTRLRGEGLESGQIYVDIDPVSDRVSVTWDNVGLYRRNTDSPALFQLQLYDRGGGDFDIVLRYERIGLTQGSAEDDLGARVLISSPRLIENYLAPSLPSGSGLGTLDTIVGNTGVTGLWVLEMRGGTLPAAQVVTGEVRLGTEAADSLEGAERDDFLSGGAGNDVLRGGDGRDTLEGDGGSDTLDGGMGDDFLFGGRAADDLRDLIYGGGGSDQIDGGAGNDDLNGGNGNDTIFGGLGADTLIGHAGADVLAGGGGSDLMFGNDGPDYLNGGFGYDRMNGGAGADRFFHLGVADHASDWIQDYTAAEGDVLVYGQPGATRAQFQVNFANTANAQGVRSGDANVAEAFVIYRPTGQILWALLDGAGDGAIRLDLGGVVVDLLA
jgi:serralysin